MPLFEGAAFSFSASGCVLEKLHLFINSIVVGDLHHIHYIPIIFLSILNFLNLNSSFF
jgi:hypothetical protein